MGTSPALPVCDMLWGFRRGPACCGAWRKCVHGWALGCRMDTQRVARTGFCARVRSVQLLAAVLGVDAASPSLLMQGLRASRMQGLLPTRGLRARRSTCDLCPYSLPTTSLARPSTLPAWSFQLVRQQGERQRFVCMRFSCLAVRCSDHVNSSSELDA